MATAAREPAGEGSRAPRPAWVDRLALGYLAFVGSFSVWACVSSFRARVRVPIVDDWRILDEFFSTPLLAWLFSNQNGHRTPVTFAIMALDYALLDGRQDLLVVASLVTATAAMVALYLGHRTGGSLDRPVGKAALGFACFATFWAGGSYTFLWGVCQGNPMVLLCLCAALACMVRFVHVPGPRSKRLVLLAFAWLAALLSTFSLGVGAAAWVALVAVAVAARLPLGVLVFLVAGFLVSVALYSLGIEATGQFSFASSAGVLLRPAALLEYVASFLGSAPGHTLQGLGLVDAPALGATTAAWGALGLLAAALYAVRLLRRPAPAGPQELLALGIMAFAVAAACMVALGRVPRTDAHDAYAMRYLSWSATFWMGAVLAVPSLVRGRLASASVAAIALASLCMLPAIPQNRQSLALWKNAGAEASLGVLLGIRDPILPQQLGAFVGLPLVRDDPELEARNSRRARTERFHRVAERLARDRRSFFADPRAELPGALVGERFALLPSQRCSGAMKAPIPLPDASPPSARVAGWARVAGEDDTSSLVVVADGAGRIRGLARPWRPARPRAREAGLLRWSGYLAGFDPSERYGAYLVLGDGHRACRLGASGPRASRDARVLAPRQTTD